MKLRFYSDIHLDWYAGCIDASRYYDATTAGGRPNFWYPPALPDDKDTTLVIAGDLWTGTSFINYAGFSWIQEVSRQFKTVLIVLGNHCYWPQGNLTIVHGGQRCRDKLKDMHIYNVHVLDCDTFEDEGILFVGATLWTDMNKADPLAMHNMPQFMNYDGKIAYETGPNGAWTRFTSPRWVQTHYKHRDYIKLVVEQNRDKKIVVITHHIPILGISDPRYHGNSSNAYYMSDMSEFILDNPHIDTWVYGHSHYQNHTIVGETMLLNNAVGYQGEHMEQQGLVIHKTIEIEGKC